MWQRQAIRHSGKFIKHVAPAVIKPIHSLWNQVIGFFFLCFGVVFGFRTFSYYKIYTHSPASEAAGDMVRVVVTAFFAVLMTCFGVSAFLKARRISRS
ncbi:MAG TPA: hypothetical protein VHW09_12365 [Bryobacteraceae bacterium]|nr:hypothetical protein [Bryobacteraceae bacterium]